VDYRWWVLLHILGAAAFLAAHGVSMWVAFKVRGERDRTRIETLLQVSGSSVALMYAGLLVLVIGGVIAGFAGRWWSFGWIWAAIGLLVMISIVMMAVASPYYRRVKEAVKLRPSGVPRVSDEELDELLQARAPMISAWLGIATLAAIIFLMVWKPF
jgi:MFS family permease